MGTRFHDQLHGEPSRVTNSGLLYSTADERYAAPLLSYAAHGTAELSRKLTLKVPSVQIGSAWEWYHWIGLEKDINRYRILFFKFWSWIFEKRTKFWALNTKMNPNSSLFVLFIYLHTNRDPNNRIRCIFVFSGSELWTPFKYSRSKLKNQKPKAVDVLFLSNGATLMQIQSGRTVPLNRRRSESSWHESRQNCVMRGQRSVFRWASNTMYMTDKFPSQGHQCVDEFPDCCEGQYHSTLCREVPLCIREQWY
jgi:hypothetical protein